MADSPELQRGDKSGWFRGKSLDTFGPIGPVIIPPDQIGDPQNLRIRCRLNGRTVQDGNTREMIFKIPELMVFVSKKFTMEPGDIIVTGTPSGVGRWQTVTSSRWKVSGLASSATRFEQSRPRLYKKIAASPSYTFIFLIRCTQTVPPIPLNQTPLLPTADCQD